MSYLKKTIVLEAIYQAFEETIESLKIALNLSIKEETKN